jgi:hypothetical protein
LERLGRPMCGDIQSLAEESSDAQSTDNLALLYAGNRTYKHGTPMEFCKKSIWLTTNSILTI